MLEDNRKKPVGVYGPNDALGKRAKAMDDNVIAQVVAAKNPAPITTDYLRDSATQIGDAYKKGGVPAATGIALRSGIGAPLAVAQDTIPPVVKPIADAGRSITKGLFDTGRALFTGEVGPQINPNIPVPPAQSRLEPVAPARVSVGMPAGSTSMEKNPIPPAGPGPLTIGDGGSNVNYIKSGGNSAAYFSPSGNMVRQGFDRGGIAAPPVAPPVAQGRGLTITGADGRTEFVPSAEPAPGAMDEYNYRIRGGSQGGERIQIGGARTPRPMSIGERFEQTANLKNAGRQAAIDNDAARVGIAADQNRISEAREQNTAEHYRRSDAETARQNLVAGTHYENQDRNSADLTRSTVESQRIAQGVSQAQLEQAKRTRALQDEYEAKGTTPERRGVIAETLRVMSGKDKADNYGVAGAGTDENGYTKPDIIYNKGTGQPARQAEAQAAKVLKSKEEFDALPPGSEYIRNGKRYRKP